MQQIDIEIRMSTTTASMSSRISNHGHRPYDLQAVGASADACAERLPAAWDNVAHASHTAIAPYPRQLMIDSIARRDGSLPRHYSWRQLRHTTKKKNRRPRCPRNACLEHLRSIEVAELRNKSRDLARGASIDATFLTFTFSAHTSPQLLPASSPCRPPPLPSLIPAPPIPFPLLPSCVPPPLSHSAPSRASLTSPLALLSHTHLSPYPPAFLLLSLIRLFIITCSPTLMSAHWTFLFPIFYACTFNLLRDALDFL